MNKDVNQVYMIFDVTMGTDGNFRWALKLVRIDVTMDTDGNFRWALKFVRITQNLRCSTFDTVTYNSTLTCFNKLILTK